MRIKLTLNSENTPFLVPFNYQPILQAVIYKVISKIDREYSKNLHQNGYWNAIDGKHYKMFVFSDLLLGKRQAQPPYLCVYNHQIEWLLSSPMSEFLQNIVNGLFKIPVIRIEKCMFHIEHVETLAEPNFSSIMKFKCLSPITVSTKENNNGKIHIKYVTPDEEDLFSAIINENLRNKYKRYKAEEPGERNVTFTFDKDYITKKNNRISRLVRIHEGREDETAIRGYIAPFTIQGDTDLMKIGYEAGFGSRNSLGFGMADVV